MSTVQSREILLKEVERRLRTLSIERLQVARDFLAYLREGERRGHRGIAPNEWI